MFQPRTFEQIRDDMWNYTTSLTDLTDFEIGAIVRTVIEAAALEDDEQYFQMVQLMDAFSIQTAQGSDLDRRVADFNIIRLQPQGSAGQVVFEDNTLVQSPLLFNILTGAVALILEDSSQFPTSGYPYIVRIGEGTVAVEDVTVSNNSVISNTLTVSATLNAHSLSDRVAYVTGASDRTITASQQVQVPAFSSAAPIKYVTIEGATLVNGNFESTPANAKAVVPGLIGNCGANQISQFTTSPPFTGCGVRNPKSFGGGRDIETDQQLRDRARGQIQSLSKGTITAIKQACLGVVDAVTGQRVVSANVLEDFLAQLVIVYIDDGTGFTPDTVPLAEGALAVAITVPTSSVVLVDASKFPAAGYVMLSPDTPGVIELCQYTAVNYTTQTLTLAAPTVNAHPMSDEVVLVDLLDSNAEPGTSFLQAQSFPIVQDSQRLWVDSGAGFQLQTTPLDYFLNNGTGQLELVTPLGSGDRAAMDYTYYTGLVKTVQTVIDGNPNDAVNFPGVRAAGIDVIVQTPVIHRVTVRASITSAPGAPSETSLAPQVQQAIEGYISSLGIGDDVIRASIIDVAMNIPGMFNVVIVSPASDVVILQNELPVPFDTNGNSLVTVT